MPPPCRSGSAPNAMLLIICIEVGFDLFLKR